MKNYTKPLIIHENEVAGIAMRNCFYQLSDIVMNNKTPHRESICACGRNLACEKDTQNKDLLLDREVLNKYVKEAVQELDSLRTKLTVLQMLTDLQQRKSHE